MNITSHFCVVTKSKGRSYFFHIKFAHAEQTCNSIGNFPASGKPLIDCSNRLSRKLCCRY